MATLTHSKETSIFNPDAIGDGIENAAKTATNYISIDPTNGIRIADADPDTATTYQHQTATETEFVVGGVSRAAISGDGARFGATDESHVELDYHSLQLVDKENDTYFHVSDLRDQNGMYVWENIVELTEDKTNYWFYVGGVSPTLTSPFTVSRNGVDISEHFTLTLISQMWRIVAESGYTCAAGEYFIRVQAASPVWQAQPKAHTFGSRRKLGSYEKYTPIGFMSTAIGDDLISSGTYSYAEGYRCEATAEYTHAEGYNSEATNWAAHAEGHMANASGSASHAQNYCTTAAYDSQTAIGKFNDNDSNNALEIGNGTSDSARSNALEVDWSGNVVAAGTVTASMQTGTMTLNTTNCTLNTNYNMAWHNGVVATVQLGMFTLNSALANGGTVVVGTVPSGYRPVGRIYANVACALAGVTGLLVAYIGSDGTISLVNRSGASLSASVGIIITATYAI